VNRAEAPLVAVPGATHTRRQLTLFVAEPWALRLDILRRALDPVQAALIAAHVTLCREDEIESLAPHELFTKVASWTEGPICLTFGQAARFNGHGVLLPCAYGSDQFNRLRQWVLQDPGARTHGAHITLAHPRNARCAGNTDATLAACPLELALRFASVALIEQQGAEPWRLIQEAKLGRQHAQRGLIPDAAVNDEIPRSA
jgi:hypothetical protein